MAAERGGWEGGEEGRHTLHTHVQTYTHTLTPSHPHTPLHHSTCLLGIDQEPVHHGYENIGRIRDDHHARLREAGVEVVEVQDSIICSQPDKDGRSSLLTSTAGRQREQTLQTRERISTAPITHGRTF